MTQREAGAVLGIGKGTVYRDVDVSRDLAPNGALDETSPQVSEAVPAPDGAPDEPPEVRHSDDEIAERFADVQVARFLKNLTRQLGQVVTMVNSIEPQRVGEVASVRVELPRELAPALAAMRQWLDEVERAIAANATDQESAVLGVGQRTVGRDLDAPESNASASETSTQVSAIEVEADASPDQPPEVRHSDDEIAERFAHVQVARSADPASRSRPRSPVDPRPAEPAGNGRESAGSLPVFGRHRAHSYRCRRETDRAR
jgi:hypothetical protein